MRRADPTELAGSGTLVDQCDVVQLGVGSTVGDRYRLEAVLGAGGMGVVHRARDLQTGESWSRARISRPGSRAVRSRSTRC